MIDFSLAREIYGNTPWMIDPISLPGFFGILNDFRNGIQLDYNEDNKLNSLYAYNINSKTKLAFDEYQLRKADDDDEIISIIKLDGPITKNGGMSSFGMRHLSNNMNRMTKDSRVKGHVIVTDSGGGSSNAVVFMSDSIKASQAVGKPVVQFIEKGGLSASAAYYIGSFSNFIISEEGSNLVGSIGTMIEMAGFPKEHKRTSDGAIFVRAYATASVHKNEEFEEALKGNLEPVTNNILDPHNDKFIAHIRNNRPSVKEEQLSGKIFEAKNVVGSLIDSIGTMDDAVNKVLELSSVNKLVIETQKTEQKAQVPKISNNNNLNIQKMDLKTLKSEHPAVYAEVFELGSKAGVKAEKDRTGAWLAHAKTDIESVKVGIASGEEISATKREEFIVKASQFTHLENLKKDSKKKIIPLESQIEGEEETEADTFYADVDEKLKKSKTA